MFRRSKSKVLVDYASEEEDMSWHYRHSYKEAKVKKMMSKKDRKDKKMFSSKDDEHFLLTCHKKVKCEKDRKEKPDKALCFWESVTMTMRQISPVKKTDKTDGLETPRTRKDDITAPQEGGAIPNGRSPSPPLVDTGDSSRYANLSHSEDPACAVTWTSRAKVRLAGISRMSKGMVSDGTWEGLK
uniref:Si:ch211-225h24.2 n=1 Tax=Hippocampus comes TaxID=109280 RepID=A0A3Q2ZB79_HIPCM